MENSADLAKQLAEYDSRRRSSVDVLNEAMSKYGVPEIRSRVSGLRTTLANTENALNAVDPSVTGRVQGSLVTEAQRTKQVANERAPIAEQYGSFSRSLGNAQADLNDQERAAQLLAQGQLNDYESGRSALSGRYQLAVDRESEQRRREEADRAYRLQAEEAGRQAAAAAKASSGYDLSKYLGTATTPSAPAVQITPQTQDLYNSVKNLLSKDKTRILREFNAIATSAGYGNKNDVTKLQLLYQLRPDLFSGRASALKLAGAA